MNNRKEMINLRLARTKKQEKQENLYTSISGQYTPFFFGTGKFGYSKTRWKMMFPKSLSF